MNGTPDAPGCCSRCCSSPRVSLITLDFRGGDELAAGRRALGRRGRLRPGRAGGRGDRRARSATPSTASATSATARTEADRLKQRERRAAAAAAHRRARPRSRAPGARRRCCKLAGAGQYTIVPAQVIAIGAGAGLLLDVTIDAGSQDGIAPDMTVLNGDGLVGRVKTVGPSTATVLLADRPGVLGRGAARGHDGARLHHRPGRRDHDAGPASCSTASRRSSAGDRLVTFGSQGDMPYVPGVPVGGGRRSTGTPGSQTRSATVAPFVDFTSLDLVGVVVEPPRTDPRDAVLPPQPAADADRRRSPSP